MIGLKLGLDYILVFFKARKQIECISVLRKNLSELVLLLYNGLLTLNTRFGQLPKWRICMDVYESFGLILVLWRFFAVIMNILELMPFTFDIVEVFSEPLCSRNIFREYVSLLC